MDIARVGVGKVRLMPQLIMRVIRPFPEPTVIFDTDEKVIVFANPSAAFLIPAEANVKYEDLAGLKVEDFVRLAGVEWGASVIAEVLDNGKHSVHHYRDDLRAWVIGSRLRETLGERDLAVFTAHARAQDEQVAFLQHTRLRSLIELALYVADARQDNLAAMRMVQANYERLQHLEVSIVAMLDDIGTHLLT